MTSPRRGRPPKPLNPDASSAAQLGAALRALRSEKGWTLEQFAEQIGYSAQHVSEVERAQASVSRPFLAECERALDAHGRLLALLAPVIYEKAMQRHDRIAARRRALPPSDSETLDLSSVPGARDDESVSDEMEAIELARRVRAGDVSTATLDGLALGVHELCRRYTRVPPAALVDAVRGYRGHLFDLLDARMALRQRRELIVTAGWLSLLAACLHVDLGQYAAARESRRAAHDLGVDAGERQIVAWGLEVRAWQAILTRRYKDAVKLCEAGRDLVGGDTSAGVQLAAQQARAQARLRRAPETHAALDEAAASCARLPTPEHPDHHFNFDPQKLISYTATALAWLGDGERAEPFAREVIDLRQREGRPRRVATARIDLALVLAQQNRPEEASDLGQLALASGRLVQSNIWRAAELDEVLSRFPDAPAVLLFHERYLGVRDNIAAQGTRR
ncbi:MAG: helix-turn-helix domain-containing protein [Solirubrobacteraceae bacterium]